MRLICPECNARYIIDAAMIPDEGREVECSACGHVWMQHPEAEPVEPQPADADPVQQPAEQPDLSLIELPEPVLQRPLPDDVLSILREETARELTARRAARGEAVAASEPETQPSASETTAPTAPPEPTAPQPPSTPTQDSVPQVSPSRPSAPVRETEPDSPPAPEPPPTAEPQDWPAMTVTSPDLSSPRVVSRQRARATPERKPPIAARPPQRRLADEALEPGLREPGEIPPSKIPPPPPRRRVTELPDVEKLAATLRMASPPAPPAEATQAPPPPEPAEQPAAPVRQTSRYGAGFGRAIGLWAGVLAVYLGALYWVAQGSAPEGVTAAVTLVESGRAALFDAATSLIDPLIGHR